ncbi:PEGA domain-containing protein [Sorangium sp. So ce1024]|uniref:PEGA domain-containing protein n=1 Tax=unclassified Sorangium TaxID=2621164 RepID=UPI003EFF0731
MTEESRKLFQNGVQAASESRWEAARALFLAARALHPHYTIDGNLGDCELHLGRYREAAEYLARYVRELRKDSTSTAEERARGEAAYAEARAKVGALVVRTNVDGARVLVDGTWRGVTPLADPVFVEPGAHTILVEHEDYTTKKITVQLGAGKQIDQRLELERRPAGPPPQEPLAPMLPPPASSAEGHAGAEERAGGPRKALLIGGAATAGAAAVAGVVFAVLSSTSAGDADEKEASLGASGGPNACAAGRRAADCSALRRLEENAATFGNVSAWSFIGAGVLGVTTAIVWAVDSRAEGRAKFHASPVVGAQEGGFMVRGTW